jgi:hypothetical protein
LLTLSLRLSMALCTKPPMPFVGDDGRSGDILPCVGDMASSRAPLELSPPSNAGLCSEGGANFWESSTGSGDRPFAADSASPDIDVLAEKRLLMVALSRTEVGRDPGELDRMLPGGGLLISGSTVDSRDMPGSCLLPDAEAASDAVSSGFFLNAADPLPPSGVWRKKVGSLAPNDAAMELLERFGSGEEGSGVLVADALSGDRDATESGRRMLPDCGLCFHDSVPDRPNAAALVAGFLGSISSKVNSAGELGRRCSESGRAVSCDGGLMVGVGVLAAFSCTIRGVPAWERGDCGV